MKVSKSKIEKLIQESIREIYGLEDELLRESSTLTRPIDSSTMPEKAMIQVMTDFCMSESMNPVSMFDMCSQICEANEKNSINCFNLCECILSRDSAGCTQCLVEICKCPKCCNICKSCCGC